MPHLKVVARLTREAAIATTTEKAIVRQPACKATVHTQTLMPGVRPLGNSRRPRAFNSQHISYLPTGMAEYQVLSQGSIVGIATHEAARPCFQPQ